MNNDTLSLLGFTRPDWQKDAACREHPEVNFFPERGESSAPAKAVCRGCLVQDECAAYAFENGIKDGIWGFQSGKQRRVVRNAARTGKREPEPQGCGTRAGYELHRTRREKACDECAAAAAEYSRRYRAARKGAA